MYFALVLPARCKGLAGAVIGIISLDEPNLIRPEVHGDFAASTKRKLAFRGAMLKRSILSTVSCHFLRVKPQHLHFEVLECEFNRPSLQDSAREDVIPVTHALGKKMFHNRYRRQLGDGRLRLQGLLGAATRVVGLRRAELAQSSHELHECLFRYKHSKRRLPHA